MMGMRRCGVGICCHAHDGEAGTQGGAGAVGAMWRCGCAGGGAVRWWRCRGCRAGAVMGMQHSHARAKECTASVSVCVGHGCHPILAQTARSNRPPSHHHRNPSARCSVLQGGRPMRRTFPMHMYGRRQHTTAPLPAAPPRYNNTQIARFVCPTAPPGVCVCVCVCDAQIFQIMLKLRGSTMM